MGSGTSGSLKKDVLFESTEEPGERFFTPLDVKMDNSKTGRWTAYVWPGFFGGDGTAFNMQDSWTNPARAHLVTANLWMGVSVFMCSGQPESAGDLVRGGFSKT